MEYPIVFIPSALTHAQSALPTTLLFNKPQPQTPTLEPQPLSKQLIGWEVLGLTILTFFCGATNARLGFFTFFIGVGLIAFQIIEEKNS